MSPEPSKSISEKQLEANRRNALKSTGPRTAEGKARTSLNALRHGLTGHLTIMTIAQREAHDLYVNEIIADLKPVGALEHSFAEAFAEDGWRLKRARALEENIYALGHPDLTASSAADTDPDHDIALAHACSFMEDPKNLQLLTLYENRLHRSHQKSFAQLGELQAERHAAYERAFEEAQLLAQLAEYEGKEYDPDEDFPNENGFVFSKSEIKAALARTRRLQQARTIVSGGWNPSANLHASEKPQVRQRVAA